MTLNLSQVTFDKQQISNNLLILLGFFLTVSVFISDILIFGIILIWLLNRNWSKKIQLIKSNNFAVSVILFFCFYLIGLIWGEFNADSWKWISKQALLLSIPIIISLPFKKETINKSLLAFLFGMCLNSVVSIGSYLELWNMNYHHYTEENVAIGFLDHFDHSVFLAFSSLIMICKFIESNNIKYRVFYLLVISLFLISLFLSHGRIGQYVFLISLFLVLMVTLFRSPKYLVAILSLIIISLTQIDLSESTFSKRLNRGIQESIAFVNLIKYSSTNTSDITVTDTAIGDRLTYIVNYTQILKNNLWLGCGTGKSIIEYQLLKNKFFPNVPARPPHNNYLFILCEIGVIGLLFWLNMFLQLFISIYKKSESCKLDLIKYLLPITFIIICLTDEYLVRHNPTLFFCFFTALLCVRKDVSIFNLKTY